MNNVTRIAIFAFVYVVMFVISMQAITDGVIDIVAWASAPIILGANALALGMVYLATFHGEAHEEPQTFQSPKLAYVPIKQQVQESQKV